MMWEDEYDAVSFSGLKVFTAKSRQVGTSYYTEVLLDRAAIQAEMDRQPWQDEVAEKISLMVQKQMHDMIVNGEGSITTKEQEEANKMRDNPLYGSF